MEQSTKYPWEIKSLTKEETAEISKYHTGPQVDCVRVGPNGYLKSSHFKNTGPEMYNMQLKPTDVFVVTFPRSGTTWTQELVWLIGNNFDYKRAAEVTLLKRFPTVEYLPFINNAQLQQWMMENNMEVMEHGITENKGDLQISPHFSPTNVLSLLSSPRFIRSHLPMSLLPPTILDIAKVVYVARDPRDVAVSYYHYYQILNLFGFTGDFKNFWKFFLEARVISAPYFPHIKEAWEKRNHPNMLFLFYEELCKKCNTQMAENNTANFQSSISKHQSFTTTSIQDLPGVVRRVAQFLEKPITEEQVTRLCDHLHIDNFRKNKSVNREDMTKIGFLNEKHPFIRKGKMGGWHEYFDEEMTAQAERWIEDNLRDTDLSFPQ